MPRLTIRPATAADVPTIHRFIEGLAVYEKMSDQMVATESMLHANLFGERRVAEAIIAFEEATPVGFALFFYSYSTFVGKAGIHLEDLFVLPEARGKGFGKALLAHLAKITVERDCGRFEWTVLDWNEPAIKFYQSVGAKTQREWLINRIDGAALQQLAAMSTT